MIPDMPQTRQCQSADTFCKAKNQKTKGRYVFNWGGGGFRWVGEGCGFRGESHPKKWDPWGGSTLILKTEGFSQWFVQICSVNTLMSLFRDSFVF